MRDVVSIMYKEVIRYCTAATTDVARVIARCIETRPSVWTVASVDLLFSILFAFCYVLQCSHVENNLLR